MKKLFLLVALAVTTFYNSFGQSNVLRVDSLKTLYSKGMLAYNEHNYEQAIKSLSSIPLDEVLNSKKDTVIGQVAERLLNATLN